jgi:hypothetical protein
MESLLAELLQKNLAIIFVFFGSTIFIALLPVNSFDLLGLISVFDK